MRLFLATSVLLFILGACSAEVVSTASSEPGSGGDSNAQDGRGDKETNQSDAENDDFKRGELSQPVTGASLVALDCITEQNRIDPQGIIACRLLSRTGVSQGGLNLSNNGNEPRPVNKWIDEQTIDCGNNPTEVNEDISITPTSQLGLHRGLLACIYTFKGSTLDAVKFTGIEVSTTDQQANRTSITAEATFDHICSDAETSPYSDGSANKPFILCNDSQVAAIQGNGALLDKQFRLATDIDLKSSSIVIGNTAQAFSGKLRGNGKVIANLNINQPASDNIGLFGVLSGSVSHLTLKSATVVGNEKVGSIAGAVNGGIVTKSIVRSANVTASSNAGGVFGSVSNATILNVGIVSSSVTSDNAGGFFGNGSNTNISKSFVEETDVAGTSSGGFGANLNKVTASSIYVQGGSMSIGSDNGGIWHAAEDSSISHAYATISGTSGGIAFTYNMANVTLADLIHNKDLNPIHFGDPGLPTTISEVQSLTETEMKTASSYSGWNEFNLVDGDFQELESWTSRSLP